MSKIGENCTYKCEDCQHEFTIATPPAPGKCTMCGKENLTLLECGGVE